MHSQVLPQSGQSARKEPKEEVFSMSLSHLNPTKNTLVYDKTSIKRNQTPSDVLDPPTNSFQNMNLTKNARTYHGNSRPCLRRCCRSLGIRPGRSPRRRRPHRRMYQHTPQARNTWRTWGFCSEPATLSSQLARALLCDMLHIYMTISILVSDCQFQWIFD